MSPEVTRCLRLEHLGTPKEVGFLWVTLAVWKLTL
uniref:Uncharacterized protein n=1 Tax=Trichinella nativa TaxID=6335 RepID=A0A0V1KH01_9BILA